MEYAQSKGVFHETSYPYTAKTETCKDAIEPAIRIKSFRVVRTKDLSRFLARLKQTPLAIAFWVAGDFFDYVSGVYDGAGCAGKTSINHAVLAVGYSFSGRYVKFKNSWGTGWGDGGYFKMKMSLKRYQDGTCNFLKFNQNVYPIV